MRLVINCVHENHTGFAREAILITDVVWKCANDEGVSQKLMVVGNFCDLGQF